MTQDTGTAADIVMTRLTDASVKAFRPPPKAFDMHWDGEIPGLAIRVTSSGVKSFVITYRHKGTQYQYTIGRYPVWPVAAARDEAKKLRREIDAGRNPREERLEQRRAPTVRDLYDTVKKARWSDTDKPWPKEVRRYFEKHILPRIGSTKVEDVTYRTIEELKRNYPGSAHYAENRMLAALSTAFNDAVKLGWAQKNPVMGVQRNRETARVHYLEPKELRRLLTALDKCQEQTSADAIRLMIFTGCRVGEALNAEWYEFNSPFSVWHKSADKTKQGNHHYVPLSKPVTEMFKRRWEKSTNARFVFPGKLGNPITHVRKTWKTACKEAKLGNRQLKSLRDSFASNMKNMGFSLEMIGEALGHSEVRTTARYAHLFDGGLDRLFSEHAEAIFCENEAQEVDAD